MARSARFERSSLCMPGAQTMIEILERSTGKVFGMRISGKILHRDYQQFVPRLEKLIEEHGSIRCLIEMIDFHGIELRALWDEIKFDISHARQIERCAVVGDRTWEAWLTKLSRPIFFNAEIRFFEQSEREKAWEWIEEGL
jgi:hypothetical protein